MTEEIQLQDGQRVTVKYQSEMWRADVDGYHFCAQNKHDLLRGIAQYKVVITPEDAPEPVVETVEILWFQLRHAVHLEDKQAAARRLKELAYAGDPQAESFYQQFLSKGSPSAHAKYLSKTLNKEFHDFSHADITEHVDDPVQRHILIVELADRFKV